VADVAATEDFYAGLLGFEVMARYGDQATFLSAGGYHHHLGGNTWNSRGATPAPPGSVQMPYQPTPHPQHANPYGTTTPPPAYTPAHTPAPAYGYPQQAGYQTPGPYAQQHTPPVAYSPSHSPSTPPPSPSGGGRKSNTPVIVGAIVVSIVAVGGLLLALNLGGNDRDNGADTGGTASASASQTAGSESGTGYKGPDPDKKIDAEECSEARESYTDPDKVRLPDFRYKNLASVKLCFQAAGWRMKTKPYEENTYGKDTVMDQFPSKDTDVDPENMPVIELSVSTGYPAS
jgi:catechol 2,3-dioxygenase-like lactoylglutathione lyase family enzyme